MNWFEVRRYNARASQRKARRETYRAQEDARIARAGGVIRVEEIRTATRRLEPRPQGLSGEFEVWTFRGRDWLVLVNTDGETFAAYPFVAWRSDGCDRREYTPMTAGASKWLRGI